MDRDEDMGVGWVYLQYRCDVCGSKSPVVKSKKGILRIGDKFAEWIKWNDNHYHGGDWKKTPKAVKAIEELDLDE
jgi:hypothetical protein